MNRKLLMLCLLLIIIIFGLILSNNKSAPNTSLQEGISEQTNIGNYLLYHIAEDKPSLDFLDVNSFEHVDTFKIIETPSPSSIDDFEENVRFGPVEYMTLFSEYGYLYSNKFIDFALEVLPASDLQKALENLGITSSGINSYIDLEKTENKLNEHIALFEKDFAGNETVTLLGQTIYLKDGYQFKPNSTSVRKDSIIVDLVKKDNKIALLRSIGEYGNLDLDIYELNKVSFETKFSNVDDISFDRFFILENQQMLLPQSNEIVLCNISQNPVAYYSEENASAQNKDFKEIPFLDAQCTRTAKNKVNFTLERLSSNDPEFFYIGTRLLFYPFKEEIFFDTQPANFKQIENIKFSFINDPKIFIETNK